MIEKKPGLIIENSIDEEPFYLAQADEKELFEKAFQLNLPVMLKGPTGIGKTRFVEYMSWKIKKQYLKTGEKFPLITISCHEDLSSGDLLGRYLLDSSGTCWQDGPLTLATRVGGICYLDEIVEARKDTTVLIHSVTDHRRILYLDRNSEMIKCHKNFQLVVSYNPAYQNQLKNLKNSTNQRFISINMNFPSETNEIEIVQKEGAVPAATAEQLVHLASKTRNLKNEGLEEGASTRSLVYAAKLIVNDVPPRRACQIAICDNLTDDRYFQETIFEIIKAIFE